MRRSRPARPVRTPTGADLHVHTTHSDGACTPADVVRSAASVGLKALAITDHDTLSAIGAAQPEAARLGVELIAGVELTAERDGREVHLLGYFVRPDDPALIQATAALIRSRAERIVALAGRLGALGLSIDLDAIRQTYPRATLGRKHLADYLVRSGQVATYRAVFDRWLGDDGPARVAKARLPWRGAIDLVRGAGGVAGWAHPPYDLRRDALQDLVAGGLGAIEVAGPKTEAKVTHRWRGWAAELGLVPTAGTDFHAPDRPGRWVGAICTPDDDLDRLRLAATATPSPAPSLLPRETNHGVQGPV